MRYEKYLVSVADLFTNVNCSILFRDKQEISVFYILACQTNRYRVLDIQVLDNFQEGGEFNRDLETYVKNYNKKEDMKLEYGGKLEEKQGN